MDRSASAVESKSKQMESSIARVGSAALKIGGAGIGIGGLLTQMASGDIEAENQLKAAIDSTGHSIDEYKDRIDGIVSSQVKFGHTDEEVNNSLRILVASYGDTGKALDEMQTVADLAAFKHISLADAANIVAKAHGGAGRVFKEFNIQVKQNADGTKDYDGALAQLSDKLKGQAAASADSFGGKLRELHAIAENFFSQLGQNYGPAILGISTGLTALGGVASAVAGLQGRLAAAHLTSAAAAEADAAATSEAAAAEALLATNSSAAVGSLYAQDAALAASGAAFGPWGIAAAAAIIAVSEAWDILGSKQDNNPLGAASANLTADAQRISQAFLALKFEGNASDANDFLEGLVQQGDAGVGALLRLRQGLEADIKTGVISQQQGAEYTAAIDRSIGEAKDKQRILTENIAAGAGNAKEMAAQFKAIADNADKAEAAALQLAPADIRVQRGTLSIQDDRSKIDEALAKLQMDRNAPLDLGETQAQRNDKVAADLRDVASARLDLQQAILDQAQAQSELTKQQDAARGVTETQDQETQNYLGSLGQLTDSYGGPVSDALRHYIWDATVAKNATNDLRSAQEALTHLNELGLAGTAAGALSGGGGPADARGNVYGGPRASGGPVHAGMDYLVGEHGPELVRFGASGNVTNAADTARMMGGSQTVNNITVVHPDAFAGADEVVRALNRRRILESAA